MSFKKFRDFFRISNFYKVISNTYEAIDRFILRRTNLNKVDKNGDTACIGRLNGWIIKQHPGL